MTGATMSSGRVATQDSIEQDADDLAALARSFGMVSAHITGNSFGAMIARWQAHHLVRGRDVGTNNTKSPSSPLADRGHK
jgi:hypothetical protein